jgi:imidazolonepropionase
MSVLDSIKASTFTSAKSLQLDNEVGSIEPGKKADLIIWGIENTTQIPYLVSDHPIQMILKNGEIIS